MGRLMPEEGFERPLRHDDVERDIESDEHGEHEEQRREQRLPDSDAPDIHHEARYQKEARHVEPEPLRDQAEGERREKYLQDAAELLPRDEDFPGPPARDELPGEPIDARRAEDQGQIERELAGLRAGP